MNEISSNHRLFEAGLLSLGGDENLNSEAHIDIKEPVPQDEGALVLVRSGLFDAAWYLKCNPDIAAGGFDPVLHFLHQGWREARSPNPYFDVEYYLAENPDVTAAHINPLLHYISTGEALGRAPSPLFDPAWYASHHMVGDYVSPLAHFLSLRMTGTVSPIPEFDSAYYVTSYKDVGAAGVDPFDHYLRYGYREGRDPSADFDTRFYVHRYLGGEWDQNPLVHYRQWRHALRLFTQMPAHENGVYEQVRAFTRAGADFEEVQPLPQAVARRAKVLAYYLPQFHRVAENDAWWGKGFTEWTAISRGMPRFAGHYQPRIPRDLGHYDLSHADTLRRQIKLAQDAGLFGFVQYFYWFNQRRLLERPLEVLLADPSLDFPFCLMWANENWTRRWDGSDQEVLISQDYRPRDEDALLACFARHFADPRYIRLGGRPLLMIYRASLIPDCAATIARWRGLFLARFNEEPILVMAQSFDAHDPTEFGFDGAIEFPPHKLTQDLPTRNNEVRCLDSAARGQIYAYDDLVSRSLAEPAPGFPLIKTAVPSWDNDARREGMGMVVHGSTPAKYQAWMEALVDRSARHLFLGERIVCVNAWNEWAEGAYLEPDVHFGAAYLNATGRAIARLGSVECRERVLLVGHDAFPAGAQLLLLNIGRQMVETHGLAVEFLLLGDGAMLPDYVALAPTHVAKDRKALAARIAAAALQGVTRALVNTSASAPVISLLKRGGIEAVLLVHELPRIMEVNKLAPGAHAGAALARRVIFPVACVRDAFPGIETLAPDRVRILPQGLYRDISFDPDARSHLRAQLGMEGGAALILGAGTGDLRKGFDLFLHAARLARRQNAPVHFCWIGTIDPTVSAYLGPEIEIAKATGMFHVPGFQDDIAAWMSAADAFALTSREDPFPSVALEAMASGLGVAAFAGGGGISSLLSDPQALAAAGLDARMAAVVALGDVNALTQALMALAAAQNLSARVKRATTARGSFDFARYTVELLSDLRDGPRVSVVVPSHNYARYLPERLSSIFAQTSPVEQVIVLDDASTDDSVAVATATARGWHRDIAVVASPQNSGNIFLQWQRAAAMVTAPWIWIAEADDAADPSLLARLSRLLLTYPDIDLAFCDSHAVDSEGATVMQSYKEYYRNSGASDLLRDGVFPAADFLKNCLAERNTILNASAVIFRTQALRDTLARCGDELPQWRVAGDWRVYVDLLSHSTGQVGYLAAPLNVHRRHAASATAMLPKPALMDEVRRMHAAINEAVAADEDLLARQTDYRLSLSQVSGAPAKRPKASPPSVIARARQRRAVVG